MDYLNKVIDLGVFLMKENKHRTLDGYVLCRSIKIIYGCEDYEFNKVMKICETIKNRDYYNFKRRLMGNENDIANQKRNKDIFRKKYSKTAKIIKEYLKEKYNRIGGSASYFLCEFVYYMNNNQLFSETDKRKIKTLENVMRISSLVESCYGANQINFKKIRTAVKIVYGVDKDKECMKIVENIYGKKDYGEIKNYKKLCNYLDENNYFIHKKSKIYLCAIDELFDE